jgi:hypothetical protein
MSNVKKVKAELVAEPVAEVAGVVVPKKEELGLYLCSSDQDMREEIPQDREKAMLMVLADHLDSQRWSTLRYWHIGKVVSTLENRGEQNVKQQVMKLCSYELRQIQYCTSLYEKFQDYDSLKPLTERLEWSNIRPLLSIRNPTLLTLLVKRVVTGEVGKKELPEAVKKVVEKERRDSGTAEAKEKEKGKTKPLFNPPAFFAKMTLLAEQSNKQLRAMEAEFLQVVAFVCDEEKVPDEQYEAWKEHADKCKAALVKAASNFQKAATHINNECS